MNGTKHRLQYIVELNAYASMYLSVCVAECVCVVTNVSCSLRTARGAERLGNEDNDNSAGSDASSAQHDTEYPQP